MGATWCNYQAGCNINCDPLNPIDLVRIAGPRNHDFRQR